LADFREVFPHPITMPVEHPKATMVAQGPSPLVFQVREPSVARVIDLTTGQEITAAALGRGEMIYVSEETGVFAGKRKLAAGPFPPGHRYGISIDSDSETQAPHPAPAIAPLNGQQ
jgi:hypothetical protein